MQAQAAAKASRAQLATADAAADASDATRQRLQQELQAAQREAAAAEAAAAAAQEDTAAARKALLGLTAEVEQQRLDGAVDDLRWPDRCNLLPRGSFAPPAHEDNTGRQNPAEIALERSRPHKWWRHASA